MTDPTPRSSPPQRSASPSLRDPRTWTGPLLTALAIVAILAVRPIFPVPSPGIPLLVTVAAAAVLGGFVPGLVSAAMSIIFVAIDASLPGQLFTYDSAAISRLVINVTSVFVMALMVGAIRRRLDIEREEVASRRAVEHQRALTETASDAMITVDAEGTIRSVNPAAESMFGRRGRDLIGRSVESLLAPSVRDEVSTNRRRYLETGIRVRPWTNVPLVAQRADGTEFPIEVSFGEYGDEQRFFTWIVRDVSSRHLLEEQLSQARKMEAIGQLAGGVAHDFNNMLTAIGGFAELIAAKPNDAENRTYSLEGILSATDRATALTRQLLAFSRRQRLEPTMLSLNETVSRIEPLLRRLLGEHVELVIHPAEDLWPVLADPSQVETVIMNLAINSRDAMPGGGRLTIETGNVELDEEYAQHHVATQPGEYVMVSVHDTGEGMDQETIRHIFEPFYTTKAIGRGTGLGLSSAYGVIKQSGGDIWVYSEPGKGTTFKIYLPRASGEVDSAETTVREAIVGGSGTVLVAEDEAVVRDLIVATLKRLGYDLVTADDGQQALERFSADPDRIDVLVSDVVMPRLGGIELVEAARRLRPGLPAILVSGYSENLLPAGSLAEGVTLLQKPFTNRRLAEAVREAIDRGDGRGRPESSEDVSA